MAKQGWSYTAGRHGHKVRVYERRGRRCLYVSVWEGGSEVKRSLGHANRQGAMDYADDLATKFRKGEAQVGGEAPTVERIFSLYRQHRTPDKGEYSQDADDRQAALWKRVLGGDFDLSKLSRRQWDAFLRVRRSGAIDARGEPVAMEDRRSVGERVLEKDCAFLRAVCRWAGEFRDEDDQLLLDRDPTRGLRIPKERNPMRPVATHDRVDLIREVYRDVRMLWGGTLVESYLPEVFEIAAGTGRRISAVCSLRVEDLEMERTDSAPWGTIVWPEDTDKMGKCWRCPISGQVRDAIEAAQAKRGRLGRVGNGPLFPSQKNLDKPVAYYEAATWLRSAESKAGLEPQEGSLWHAYRRLWASSRKNLPDVDVAQAGGWASLEALKQAYQRPDMTRRCFAS